MTVIEDYMSVIAQAASLRFRLCDLYGRPSVGAPLCPKENLTTEGAHGVTMLELTSR